MLNALFQSLSMELLPRFICLLIDLDCTNIHVAKTVQILLLASLKHDVGTDGLINEKLQELSTQPYQIQAAIRRREDTFQPPPRKRQKIESLDESCLKLDIGRLNMELVNTAVVGILSKVSSRSWSRIIGQYITSRYAHKFPYVTFDNLIQPVQLVKSDLIDINSSILKSESQINLSHSEPIIVKEISIEQIIDSYNDEISKPTLRNLVQVYGQLLMNTRQTLDWRKLVTKYAVQFSQLKPQLLDFVCEDFHQRWELALMWMYVDMRHSRHWFKQIFDRVKLGDMEHFLMESPVLIINFVKEEWQSEIGMIERLCRARGCARESCIDGLLQLSSDTGKN